MVVATSASLIFLTEKETERCIPGVSMVRQETAAVDLKQKGEVILGPRDLVNINCKKES